MIDASLGDYFNVHLNHRHENMAHNEVVIYNGQVAQAELTKGVRFPIKWIRDGHDYEFADEIVSAVAKQVLNSIKDVIPPNSQVGLFYLILELPGSFLHVVIVPGKNMHEPMTEDDKISDARLETAWNRV